MLNTAFQILAYAAIALGAVHSVLALRSAEFDLSVLWFFGSGLAIIFAGFLNLAFNRSHGDRLVRAFCIIADLTLTILFAAAFFTVLPEPQVVIGSAIFAALTALSIWQK